MQKKIYRDSLGERKSGLPAAGKAILVGGMIRGGFLALSIREDLIALVRDGKAETRLTRRANALLLLDDGMSCEAIAKVLYLDDDTIRYWYKLFGEKGLTWLADFGYKGRACELTMAQQDGLKTWVAQTLPRTTTIVGEWIERSYGVSYTRSALIKLLRRIDVEYRRPEVIPRKLDPVRQQEFIATYDNLLNTLGDDEAVLFADAVHPTHEARPAGCWAPKNARVALEQTSGRQRLNIHGAIDLETGATRMIEATTIDALSTIALLMAIALMYPTKRLIHVFLDNARYHHAVLVQQWLARPGCRIKVHYIPSYCPHLDPIERLWGLMHRHVTHNRCYATYNEFCRSVLHFLRAEVPKSWAVFCDSVTDNFRVINPADFRVLRA
jgi:transposase